MAAWPLPNAQTILCPTQLNGFGCHRSRGDSNASGTPPRCSLSCKFTLKKEGEKDKRNKASKQSSGDPSAEVSTDPAPQQLEATPAASEAPPVDDSSAQWAVCPSGRGVAAVIPGPLDNLVGVVRQSGTVWLIAW